VRSRHLLPLVVVLLASLVAAASASAASPSGVVISKLRLRTAASQFDEYVEVQNTSSATVDLSGWQLFDCFTSGGTSRVGTDGDPLGAGTKLPAGQTFVFGKNAGDYTGTADATYNFQVTEVGGFLIKDAGAVTQDAVGAPGTGCAEGPGLTFPTTGADFTFTRRAAGAGLQDTDDNAADFAGPSGAANGSACGQPCEPPPTPLAIDAIQGSGATSPRNGQLVQITGVVIGVDNQQGVSNFVNLDARQAGIYVETPTSAQDANPATSEGIFVGGLSAADRSARHIGQTVTVVGKVTELFNLTAIDATGRTLAFSGTADRANLPAPVTIDPAQAAAQTAATSGNRPYYETLEGMRVRLAVGTADSGGTNKFGELFLRPGTTRERVFRVASLPVGPADLIKSAQDAGSRDVDPTNPSRNPDSRTRVNADLFDSVSDLVGPMGFTFLEYQVTPQPGEGPHVHRGPTRYPPFVPSQPRRTLRVANFNMENLFAAGMTDDGHTFTQPEVDAKTTRLADAVGNVLHRPDVVVTEEVAALAPLQEVARKLHGYTAYWLASTDARHIAVGLLVKRGVAVSNLRQFGRDATTTATGCADDGVSNKLFERPPLEVDLRKDGLSFTLIGNHLASQSHPEPCRSAQTQFLHDETAALEAAGRQVMVIGDLNDFEDGAALTQNLVSAGVTLKNLWSQATADNRYSFQFDGQLQTLDHIFVTDGLHAAMRDVRYVHFDNDYFERDETRHAAGVSDHDPPLVTIALPQRHHHRGHHHRRW
jgi:predicted extracellular nuclease